MAAPAGGEPASIDLTTTQYVILAENQRKKRALAEAKERCGRLEAENAALLAQLEEQRAEGYAVVERFRGEVLAKNGQIAQLQAKLEHVNKEKDAHAARLQEAAAAREAQLHAEAEAAAQELYARVDALQAELDAVCEYREKQVEFESVVAALREESQGLREALAAQKTELERYYAGQNAKMRKEYEQRLEELKHAQDEELEERLDASVKRILTHNRHLAEELRLHVQESDVLQSEVRLLESERSRLLRELALKVELEEGFAKRGAAQGAALKSAQVRIAGLESSLAQLLADFQRERAEAGQRAEAQVAAARDESEALRRLLRLKTRELKSLRALGHEALLQRSEVEIFLIGALAQARAEAEAERSSAAAGAGAQAQQERHAFEAECATAAGVGQQEQQQQQQQQQQQARASAEAEALSALAGGSGAAAAGEEATGAAAAAGCSAAAAAACEEATAAGDEGGASASAAAAAAFDVRDLTWQERERVLRLLFARIAAHAGGGG